MNLVAMRAFTRFLTNTNSTTYSDTDLDASINTYNDLFCTEILDSMDEWDFSADYATTNLVASQQEYILPTDILKIKRVEISYDGTNWYLANPMDINERGDTNDSTSVNNDFSTSAPYYDLMDESIMLYPIPSAASTAGLKVWYEKSPTTITTSVNPGFVQPFHKGLCYGAAKDYFDKYSEVAANANKAVSADNNLEKYIQRMKAFYRKRNQDRKYTIEPAFVDYGYGTE
jgi:hypothetical protein